jgi:hypothetical protein
MAKLSEVRHLLRCVPGAKVSRKKGAAFPVAFHGFTLTVPEAVVDQYLAIRGDIRRPYETAMSLPGYYEQAMEFQGRTPMTSQIMREDGITMENKEKTRTIFASPISDLFSLALLDSDELSPDLQRFLQMSRSRMRWQQDHGPDQEQPNSINTLLARIRTVKVNTGIDDPIATNDKRLHALCEAALFHVAYGWGVGISLSISWERAYYRFGLRRRESVQFPLRTYKSELLSYYHLAFGSDSLILAYLALYKILEYFFTSASERQLHGKVSEKLVEPDFLHTKSKKLRELVKTIRAHDSRMDEKRMLATVLSDSFDPEELRDWIIEHNTDNGDYYTTEHQVFAEPVRIDISNDQLFSTIAHRIYHIRNALVHHKEGEVSRFIPFSGQEQVLFREIPLLLFIAEQLIIKTGKDI